MGTLQGRVIRSLVQLAGCLSIEEPINNRHEGSDLSIRAGRVGLSIPCISQEGNINTLLTSFFNDRNSARLCGSYMCAMSWKISACTHVYKSFKVGKKKHSSRSSFLFPSHILSSITDLHCSPIKHIAVYKHHESF